MLLYCSIVNVVVMRPVYNKSDRRGFYFVTLTFVSKGQFTCGELLKEKNTVMVPYYPGDYYHMYGPPPPYLLFDRGRLSAVCSVFTHDHDA